jgi:deoxyribonucleoside regulator
MQENNINKTLLKVARMFYEEGLSKTEIANDVRYSVTHVNRMLNEAKQRGIVSIHIESPRFEDLELKLSKKYNLNEVRIITSTQDQNYLRIDLGQEAANYFDENIKNGQKVGVGSGRTLYQMISHIKENPRNIKIYPINIITQRHIEVTSLDANSLVNTLWFKNRPVAEALKVELFYPHISITEARKEIQKLDQNEYIKDFINNIQNLDFYFLSVGNLRKDSTLVSLASEVGLSFEEIKEKGIIGDCIFNILDKNGNYISCGLDNLRIGLSMEHLSEIVTKEKAKVICVAGGIDKIEILRTCLRKRVFNVLITDQMSADYLLES